MTNHRSNRSRPQVSENAAASARKSADKGPLSIAEVIDGKYHIERVLGRGSMGVVYLARDQTLERRVAVKVLAPHYAQNERVSQRFRREAVAMASVRNEHVVQIYSYGEHSGYPYFVMEYVPGYNVANLIDNAREKNDHLYLDVIIGILRQVSEGLEAVHAAGIVHRDVKPANMLIGTRFRVAVTDFGLVEILQPGVDGRDLAGTPLYLAPELIRRQPIAPEKRHLSDIYALGISTYEMLTGDVPFDGDNIKDILRRHLDTAPAPISDFRTDIPAAVDQVIQQALSKDPADRPQTCQEFVDRLVEARSKSSDRKMLRTGTQRILVVDNDEQSRAVFATALKVGFPNAVVLTTDDGLSALEMARASNPDVMFVDLQLANLNGLELCAALSGDEITSNIPVVVVTKPVDAGLQSLLCSIGAREIITKPLEATELVTIAQKYVISR